MAELRAESLGGGITVFVSDAHGFGTDAVLLARFAAPSAHAVCCDLGSGCGVIPLLWCKQPTGALTAVELQPDAAAQICRAVEVNHLHDRLTVRCADLRALHGLLPAGGVDLVTMNPPYYAAGMGCLSAEEADQLARHETVCTPQDLCAAAARLLKFGGRFCVCIRPERLTDYLCAMRAHALEPKRLRPVAKNPARAPWLLLLEGRRGGKPGLRMEPTLFVHAADGTYTEEMKQIYGDYLLEHRRETL